MSGNVLTQLQANGGDFNLFFSPPGPLGTAPLELTTGGEGGDPIAMTEFSSDVPEPSIWAMLGIGVLGLGFALRKGRNTTAAAF